MKTGIIHTGISILLLFIMTFFSHEVILAQDEDTIPGKQQDEWKFNLPRHGLSSVLMDTVRPTLSNNGKGLLQYDCTFLEDQGKMHLYKYRREEKTIMIKSAFTELDLKIMNQNLFYLDKQYQSQIKEWLRKEKMDWNLGEAIKGFYMTPVY